MIIAALVGTFNQENIRITFVSSTSLHRVRGGVGADELVQPLGPGEAEEGEQPRHRQLRGEAQVLEPHQVDPAGEPGTQLLQISSLVSI